MSFTKHREKFQQNKSNADPTKPPGYDECLSVIDMRPHKRKDKSKAPGTMFPRISSLSIPPSRRDVRDPNVTFQFPAGAVAAPMNPANANGLTLPPIQFLTSMYQAPPRSPTAQDLETIRRAKILFEAAASVWDGDDDDDDDDDDDREDDVEDRMSTSLANGRTSSEQSPQPVHSPTIAPALAKAQLRNSSPLTEPPKGRSKRKRKLPAELYEQAEHVIEPPGPRASTATSPDGLQNSTDQETAPQIPSSPHVPIYLTAPSKSSTNPPRQGFVIKFDSQKGAVKSPTPPPDPPVASLLSVSDPPPRHGTIIRLPDQPATRLNSNHVLAEPAEGVPQYLHPPPPVLPPFSSFSHINPQAAQSQITTPSVTSGFKPINGNGITYLPPIQRQQYSFTSATPEPRSQRPSQSSAAPSNGTVDRPDEQAPNTERPLPPAPPKNGTVLKLYGPAPVSEHPPREKPPKNGTIIKFPRPYKAVSKKNP